MTFSDIVGLSELRTALFYRRLVAEAVGTAILVIFGCGSAMAVNPAATALKPSSISIAVSFGLAIATMIWCIGGVSGAHINPSVSLIMFITRKISLMRCVAYMVVQCGGAIGGAALLWVLTPSHRRGTLGVTPVTNEHITDSCKHTGRDAGKGRDHVDSGRHTRRDAGNGQDHEDSCTLGATLIAEEISVWQGLVVEMIATFILVLTVFASCDRLRADHGGSVALSIGLVVTLDIPWAVQYTGASMNPARSLGPSVMTGLWKHHWVYWVGPIVGALVAGFLYEFVFDQRHIQPSAAGSDVTTQETEVVRSTSNEDVNDSAIDLSSFDVNVKL